MTNHHHSPTKGKSGRAAPGIGAETSERYEGQTPQTFDCPKSPVVCTPLPGNAGAYV
jgi:hypothetical protein